MTETAAPKTLIVIPALNEEVSIGRVIGQIREQSPLADILVVNDGSADETGRIAEECGAIVLHMPHNVGIGASVQAGFMFADENDYSVVIRNDGDGQHTAEDIPAMMRALAELDADVVVGSRYLEDRGYTGTITRRLGSMILARLISSIIGGRITDPTSGFVACNRRAIKLFAQVYPHDYPEPESIVVVYRAGLKLREIPVTMKPRMGGQSSITILHSGYYMVKVILSILVGLLRPAPVIDAT